MYYIAIDPGFKGAWGIVDHHSNYIACGDMLNDGKYIMASHVYREITNACSGYDKMCIVEQVHSMPNQGVASSFKFGMAFGAAISIAQRIGDWQTVTPQKWKKDMGLSKDKNLSLKLAKELWLNAPITKKKDIDKAEALLLAEYLRRKQHELA